jgi:hypothetical protein
LWVFLKKYFFLFDAFVKWSRKEAIGSYNSIPSNKEQLIAVLTYFDSIKAGVDHQHHTIFSFGAVARFCLCG